MVGLDGKNILVKMSSWIYSVRGDDVVRVGEVIPLPEFKLKKGSSTVWRLKKTLYGLGDAPGAGIFEYTRCWSVWAALE